MAGKSWCSYIQHLDVNAEYKTPLCESFQGLGTDVAKWRAYCVWMIGHHKAADNQSLY